MSCDLVKINKRSEFILEGIISVSMSKSSKFENIECCCAHFLLEHTASWCSLVNFLGLNEAIHMATTKFKSYCGQTEVAHIRELSHNKLLSPAMLIFLRPAHNLFK
jgi:hypothetical protein